MDKPRCQALLLTPQFRNWAKYGGRKPRCRYPAKPDSNFCGNHAQVADLILEIIWKED